MSKQICMLAHLYDPKRVIFPAYIQPKLDGVRAIWKHKEKVFVSRNNKLLVTSPNIISKLISCPYDLDGEFTIPNKVFNEISGVVRHLDMIPEKHDICYQVFDIIDEKLLYLERYILLNDLLVHCGQNLYVLPALNVKNISEIEYYHSEYLRGGYEGSIIRNNTSYELKRSFNLLKLKPTKEINCTIIGLLEGTGKYEGMLGAFTVKTEEGKIFNVGSGFTDEERAYIWKNSTERYDCIQLKVKYQDLSEYGIPRFPVFKGFKEWK